MSIRCRSDKMANKLLAWIRSDPRIPQYTVGFVGAFVAGGYALPNGPFMEKYKRVFQAFREGEPVPLSPELCSHVDAALDAADLPFTERSQLRFFTAYGGEPWYAGDTGLRWGATVGLPQTLQMRGATELEEANFSVAGQRVDWQSREGRLLADCLCLSPAAKRFLVARQLWHVRASEPWVDGCLTGGMLIFTYALGSSFSRRLGLKSRPMVLRVTLYSLVSLFGATLWVTCKDMLAHYRDRASDMFAAGLGPDYAWAGVEFYEKLLGRNRALRCLDPQHGEATFTAYGNGKTMIRQRHMALTERLEGLRAYCEREHPRDATEEVAVS